MLIRIATLLAITLWSTVASSKEPILNIVVDEAAKRSVIQALEQRLSLHESMTREEIIQDMKEMAARNDKIIARMEASRAQVFREAIARSINSVSALSKEAILLKERVEMQHLMSAADAKDCGLFWLTNGDNWYLWVLTVPLDLVLLIPRLVICYL